MLEDGLTEAGASVGLPGRTVKLSPAQQVRVDAFLQDLNANPYAPKTDRRPDEELLAYLADRRQIVVVAEDVAFSAAAYQEMLERILSQLAEQGRITLAQARDMFGTSRKYVQALLEYLDEQRITQRVGEERVLHGGR